MPGSYSRPVDNPSAPDSSSLDNLSAIAAISSSVATHEENMKNV